MADRAFPRLVTDIALENARLREEAVLVSSLKSGDGDGTSSGMEARVARLEADVDNIKRDVGDLKIDVRALRTSVSGLEVSSARLDERVKALPGKGFIVSASITIIGLLSAIVVFGEKLRELLGVTH